MFKYYLHKLLYEFEYLMHKVWYSYPKTSLFVLRQSFKRSLYRFDSIK